MNHSLTAHSSSSTASASWLSAVLLVLSSFSSGIAFAAEPAAAPAPQSPARPASKDAMPAVKMPAAPVSKSADAAAPKGSASAAAQPARRAGSDRLDLDTTVVTGNRELPKVLYIVPWKRSDLGDLPPQPINSLLDEALTPVDRDVFRREVTYYGAMTETDGAAKGPPAASPAGSEK